MAPRLKSFIVFLGSGVADIFEIVILEHGAEFFAFFQGIKIPDHVFYSADDAVGLLFKILSQQTNPFDLVSFGEVPTGGIPSQALITNIAHPFFRLSAEAKDLLKIAVYCLEHRGGLDEIA